TKPSWDSRYTSNDYHQQANKKLFYNHYVPSHKMLNISAATARNDLITCVKMVASKLLEWKNLSTSNNIIKLIVPTLSADDETEYPFASFNDGTHIDAILSGFSPVEIQKFMTFLQNKYKNVNNLNKIWKNISGANSNFNSIDSSSITIRSYGWETIKPLPPAPFTFYNYPEGRRDFLEFRINELKKFIDTCAYEVHNYGV